MMAPLGLLCLRRRRFRAGDALHACALAAFTLLLTTLTACGTGRYIPGSSTPVATPTPSGTYNLTVTGSTAGVSHSVGLTLIVQ
jgi:hypothetical protein